MALNLFHANVDTKLGIVYGQVPSADVGRAFSDADDDIARVGSEMMERILQLDLEREDDGYQAALRYSLKDWQIAGLGQAWVRYEVETREEPETAAIMGQDPISGEPVELAPAVPARMVKVHEDAAIDYVYWEDFRWQPARSWHLVDWVAKRVFMTKDDLVKRFGEDKAKLVPMQNRTPAGVESVRDDIKDAWSRAEVWEIACKSTRTYYWYVEGMAEILDTKPDPLELDKFFPCPRPIISNVTSSKWMPKPDYCISERLYEACNELFSQILELETSAKVRFIYDKTIPELARLFTELGNNEGVGVGNWGLIKERGGLNGVIEFAPIEPVAKVIAVLVQQLQEKMGLLYQETGLSDIVRGYSNPNETLGAQKIKAGFAGTRLQSEQDEVARFASEILQLRSEIVTKHFDPETIVARSNIMRTHDAQKAQPAVQMLKERGSEFRVTVKADSLALRDYAALKSERAEALQTLGGFFQSTLPTMQMFPPSGPFFLKLAQWLVAATKGAQTMEADFDELVAAATQAAQQAMAPKPPPPPDPKVVAEQQKAQASVATAQIGVQKAGIDLTKAKVDLVGDIAKAVQPKPPPGPGGIPNA
jgi:hypothetical protein